MLRKKMTPSSKLSKNLNKKEIKTRKEPTRKTQKNKRTKSSLKSMIQSMELAPCE